MNNSRKNEYLCRIPDAYIHILTHEKVEIIKTEITKKEFEFYLGKFCAIIGITNKGFADKIREILA